MGPRMSALGDKKAEIGYHDRSWHSGNACVVLAHGAENRPGSGAPFPSAPAHASTLDRIQARQRRPRHTVAGALSRSPQLAINSKAHCACAGSLHEVLEGLKPRPIPLMAKVGIPRQPKSGGFSCPKGHAVNIVSL